MKFVITTPSQEAAKRGQEDALKQDAFERATFELGFDIQNELCFAPPTDPILADAYREGYRYIRWYLPERGEVNEAMDCVTPTHDVGADSSSAR